MFYGRTNDFRIVSSVVTPQASHDLTTLADVYAELNITTTDGTRDSVMQRYISSVSAAIERYCNRTFVLETVQDQFFPLRDKLPIDRKSTRLNSSH